MGLVVFPEDGDVTSPDVSWPYTGVNRFREWLAEAEGFALAEMYGFGGDRPWSSVSTTLALLLDHPDDDVPTSHPLNARPCCPGWRQSSTSGNTMAAISFSNGTPMTPASWSPS